VVFDVGAAVGADAAGFAGALDPPLEDDEFGASCLGAGALDPPSEDELAFSCFGAGADALDPPSEDDELGDESAGFGPPAAFAPSELLPLELPLLEELPPLEPLEEPLLEDLEELAGLGAGEALSPPPLLPPGDPATSVGTSRILATVCTAAVVGDNAVGAWVEVGVESRVPISHTSAAAPNSSDTDPARHIRDSTETRTRAGSRDWARDGAGAGTGGTARVRCLPAGVTDIITGSPRIPDTVTVSSPRSAGRPKTGRENRGSTITETTGFRGSSAPRSDRITSHGHVTRRHKPKR
jgi:hypothetical protein